VILLSSTLTLKQFHVGFRLFETRRVRVRLELGLGVGLGAIKLLIADCGYATHGNQVPVAGTGYTTLCCILPVVTC